MFFLQKAQGDAPRTLAHEPANFVVTDIEMPEMMERNCADDCGASLYSPSYRLSSCRRRLNRRLGRRVGQCISASQWTCPRCCVSLTVSLRTG
jgi:hypothetical protein